MPDQFTLHVYPVKCTLILFVLVLPFEIKAFCEVGRHAVFHSHRNENYDVFGTAGIWKPNVMSYEPKLSARRRYQDDDYYQDDGYYRGDNADDKYYQNDDYENKNEDFEDETEGFDYQPNDIYDSEYDDSEDYSNNESSRQQKPFFWESVPDSGKTEILLPSTISSETRESHHKPAILHFIGGTGIGSLPKKSYQTFLESLMIANSNIAGVVVTPLPIANPHPFDHAGMARTLAENFKIAYDYVLVDEYGDAECDQMPIVGIGHSLGARLHVLMGIQEQDLEPSRRDNPRRINTYWGLERFANIFVSFNNYSLRKSIPLFDSRIYNSNLVSKIQRQVMKRFSRTSKGRRGEMEFTPSPSKLFRYLSSGRYHVKQNLIVQFDNDDIDQSIALASHLQTPLELVNNDASNRTSEEYKTNGIKFARLAGNHLTPCGGIPGLLSLGKNVLEYPAENDDKSNADKEVVHLSNLVSTVSSYIDHVVPQHHTMNDDASSPTTTTTI